MTFPPDFSLIIPSHTPVSTELACKLIPAILDEGHPFKLEITSNSGVVGKTGDQWVEVRANSPKGLYVVCFVVKKGIIVNLLAVISPTGAGWRLSETTPNPVNYITQEQWQALTRLLIPQKGVFSVRPLFRIEMDGKIVGPWLDLGPSPARLTYPRDLTHGRLFESEEEAEKIKLKLEAYHENALTRESKKTKKS